MARVQFSATVGTVYLDGSGFPTGKSGSSTGPGAAPAVTGAAALTAAAATVAADVATLVADGASPTQAHVTTLNTDYTALAAAIVTSGAATNSGDVLVDIDTSKVTTVSRLRLIFDSRLSRAAGSATFKP